MRKFLWILFSLTAWSFLVWTQIGGNNYFINPQAEIADEHDKRLEKKDLPVWSKPFVRKLRIATKFCEEYADDIKLEAMKHEIPENELRALIRVESNCDADAESNKGARGLTQVMPATAPEVGVKADDLWIPHMNLHAGAKYLRQMKNRFGNRETALYAYNHGPGATEKFLAKKYDPSQDGYVKSVLAFMRVRNPVTY